MNHELQDLSLAQLIVATILVLAAGGISLILRLGIERRLGLAALRAAAQLLLIGYVLRWVFGLSTPWAVGAVMLVMLVAASRAAVDRPARRYRGMAFQAFAALVVSGTATTFAVTGAIIRADPWFNPYYVIPLLGMVLGNSLTGVSLCLDQLLETLAVKRLLIEMELAHGATRWEAAQEPVRSAVRRGMIPIINSMMVVGIVSLPGMMTGQILAGADPLVAVKYQIVVMFMLSVATALGCMLSALLVYTRLFNHRHQLLAERIEKR